MYILLGKQYVHLRQHYKPCEVHDIKHLPTVSLCLFWSFWWITTGLQHFLQDRYRKIVQICILYENFTSTTQYLTFFPIDKFFHNCLDLLQVSFSFFSIVQDLRERHTLLICNTPIPVHFFKVSFNLLLCAAPSINRTCNHVK